MLNSGNATIMLNLRDRSSSKGFSGSFPHQPWESALWVVPSKSHLLIKDQSGYGILSRAFSHFDFFLNYSNCSLRKNFFFSLPSPSYWFSFSGIRYRGKWDFPTDAVFRNSPCGIVDVGNFSFRKSPADFPGMKSRKISLRKMIKDRPPPPHRSRRALSSMRLSPPPSPRSGNFYLLILLGKKWRRKKNIKINVEKEIKAINKKIMTPAKKLLNLGKTHSSRFKLSLICYLVFHKSCSPSFNFLLSQLFLTLGKLLHVFRTRHLQGFPGSREIFLRVNSGDT